MPTMAQLVSELEAALSRVRLESYRPPGGSDLDMVVNYFWNIDLAEALLPSLHAAELALRNAISNVIAADRRTDLWYYEPDLLEPGQLQQFAQALLALTRKKAPPTGGRIVAQLSFGFWVTMLSGPYERRLWSPNGYALLLGAFPHAGPLSRKQAYDRFNTIRELRNRVFHYEAIWNRPNLAGDHAGIREAIGWISPSLGDMIAVVDTFAAVHGGRAGVEARILSRVNP